MKKQLRAFCLLAILTAVWLLPFPAAQAEGTDLLSYVSPNLTEVMGYTSDEAEQFICEMREDGTAAFWHPDRPEWVYTLSADPKTGQITGSCPFSTGYVRFPGENTVRALLDTIREENLPGRFSEKSRGRLTDLLVKENIRPGTELLLAQDAGSALHGFFESCYGPMFAWPEALRQRFEEWLEAYGLTWEAEAFHTAGTRMGRGFSYDGSECTLALFDGEIPRELQEAFSDPRLDGWECLSGAVLLTDGPASGLTPRPESTGNALAAFKKDGHCQLFQLTVSDGAWKCWCLGENALLPSGDFRVTWDGIQRSFALEYLLSSTQKTVYYLYTGRNETVPTCLITAMERLNSETGEAVWIPLSGSMMPTWRSEMADGWYNGPKARFPQQLGLVPLELFPATQQEAESAPYPGLPENFALVQGVNFRTQTSSRSRSHGELKSGVMIPVLDVRNGDPSEWIHTRLGFLEGYVVSSYTSLETDRFSTFTPQPVAKAVHEITLKTGKGWFARSSGTFPAGTKMHVILEDGDLLYIDIPRGEMNWLMDPEGTFGYVSKKDVVQAVTASQLDWMND